MTSIWLRDLAAYVAQSTLLIAAAGALAAILRLRDPRLTLGIWRTLLLGCVLLPVLQTWKVATPPNIVSPPLVERPVAIAPAMPVAPQSPALPIDEIVLLLAGAGIVARCGWLAAGATSLRRLRQTASPVEPTPLPFLAAEARVGAAAEILASDQVSGPITFGALRPVVVIPPAVLALEPSVQEAIACHELLHVRRGDWVQEVLEEAVRTVLWFHPAVRWLIGRIQLAREQVVDRAAIELTESRERYVDALMAVALARTRPALAPAPLFLRRRLLKARVSAIFQETAMSTRRIVISVGACAAVLVTAAILSIRLFPLEAQGQKGSGAPVEIVAGGDQLLHARVPEYPGRAIERNIQGDVVVELTVDDRGAVSDARVLSGPDELRRGVLESVLGWHYANAVRSTITQATIRFNAAAANARLQAHRAAEAAEVNKGELTPGQKAERLMMEIDMALKDPNTSTERKQELQAQYDHLKKEQEEIHATRRANGETVTLRREGPGFANAPVLTQITSERVSPAVLADLTKRLGVQVGDRITEATAKQIRETVQSVDEHLRVVFHGDEKGGLVIVIVAP